MISKMSKRIDSRDVVSDYIFYSKYSRTKSDGTKESWDESVARVMSMHWSYFENRIKEENKPAFQEVFQKAWEAYSKQIVLGSQRALQYGGEQLLKNHLRLYNCSALYANRIDFFQEVQELLLSGAGVGYSVQRKHTEQLPIVRGIDRGRKQLIEIEDSIEGWAMSTGELIKAYYSGTHDVILDYSKIRPEGAFVSGGFKAPGPEPLKKSHEKIRAILDNVKGRKLRPFEIHWITCIIADAVISGGIRRSAMISLFDIDDREMYMCKTKDWYNYYPELCRCNNSAVILPDTPKEKYLQLFEMIKEYGEPGVVFLKDSKQILNPCGEVGMVPEYVNEDGSIDYGVAFCNLTEINGAKIKSEEDFYKACEAAAILGTFQAAYTGRFPVLTETSKKIAERDALIGVGITGMADNPTLLFNPEVQRHGAEIVKRTNQMVAEIIGINPAARTTVIKPSGNASQLLKCASGVHAYHFRKYIRNIQANNNEQAFQEFAKANPHLVSTSYWNPKNESVLSFPVELDEKALVRTDYTTIEFLERILLTKRNWIESGTNFNHPSQKEHPDVRMNVSCTVSVKDDEWEKVADFVWENRDDFCGISFLNETVPNSYPQMPYTQYLDEKELVDMYGKGAILSSGLIVDALDVFNDIWTACNAALNPEDKFLSYSEDYLFEYLRKHMKDNKLLVEIDGLFVSDVNAISSHLQHKVDLRNDWVRRFKKFAANYFDGDLQKCADCLKQVDIFHHWQKISKQNKIEWTKVQWETMLQDAGSQVGTACSGGKCEI